REQRGDLLVGRDHQVLDQAVRLRLHRTLGAGDVALVVEAEVRLDAFHRERPGARTPLFQRAGDRPRGLEWLRPGVLRALLPAEDPVDAVVVQALVRADDAAIEGRALDVRAREIHLYSRREAVLVRAQRAGVVGQ